jgi:hypothetical protein
MNNKRTLIGLVLIILVMIVLTSCANREIVDECLTGHTYNFWGGLWHGIIAPFDFIGMLLHKNVTIYAQNNNGNWYAFGFLLGSGGWGLLGGKGIFGRRHYKRSRE